MSIAIESPYRPCRVPRLGAVAAVLSLIGLSLWLTLVAEPVRAQDKLAPYSARYATKAMGMGMTLTRTLAEENGRFTLTNKGSVFIAKLSETSQFHLENGRILGENFAYKLSGVVSRRREVQFDPEASVIRSLKKKAWTEHPWRPEILDRLSQQEQLRLDLINAEAPPERITFFVVDGPAVKERVMELVGEETISVKAGEYATLHYRRLHSNPDRTSNIWVAPALDYLMVRTVHVDDGSTVKVELLDTDLQTAEDA